MFAADIDSGLWNTFDGQVRLKFSHEEFLFGKAFAKYPGQRCVIENRHLDPRGPKSVAQVYTPDELEILQASAREHGVEIRAFAAKKTPAARNAFGISEELAKAVADNNKKLIREIKQLDVEAIWHYVPSHPAHLMKWPRENAYLDEVLTKQRDEMTLRLNEMRPYYDSPEVDHAEELINAMFPEMSEALRRHAGKGGPLRILKTGPRKGQLSDFKPAFVMSFYVGYFTSDGKLRLNPHTGKSISLNWFDRLIKQHAFHDRGGTARSNLMYHHMGNLLRSTKDIRPAEEKWKEWKQVRHEFGRLLKKYGEL